MVSREQRKQQQQNCKHEYVVLGFGNNRAGDQTVREGCTQCDKRKETTGAQQLAFQKMQQGRRIAAYRRAQEAQQ